MVADEVVAGRKYLSAIGQWPRIPARSNPMQWLAQFGDEEQNLATALLDNLIFFSAEQTTKLFATLVHSLSAEVCDREAPYEDARQQWIGFLDSCVVTFPTGERPGPTDSGHLFARLARYVLGFPEERILQPDRLINHHWSNPDAGVLFVDDFAGSGDQFLATWNRQRNAPDRSLTSIAEQFSSSDRVYYLPVVATSTSFDRIAAAAPSVNLRTAHLLGNEYSLIDPTSAMCPPEFIDEYRDSLIEIAERAGFTGSALGYGDLALTIAFEHGVPDATIPAIHEMTATWEPLMRRS